MKVCIRDKSANNLRVALEATGVALCDLHSGVSLQTHIELLDQCRLLLLHETEKGWEDYWSLARVAVPMPLSVVYTDNTKDFVFDEATRTVYCSHAMARARVPAMVRKCLDRRDGSCECDPMVLSRHPAAALSLMMHELFLESLPLRIQCAAGRSGSSGGAEELREWLGGFLGERTFSDCPTTFMEILDEYAPHLRTWRGEMSGRVGNGGADLLLECANEVRSTLDELRARVVA